MPGVAVRTHSSVNLFMVVSFAVLLLVFAAAGGLFVYEKAMHSQINSLSKDIDTAKNSLHEENISTWKRLDDRINISKQLMQSHIATSLLFKLLEDQTMRRIQFTSMDFSSDTQGMRVAINGITDSYATLALQADVLGSESVSKYLKDAIISNLALDDQGHVSFSLTASVNPGLVSYNDLISMLNGEANQTNVIAPVNVGTSSTTTNQ